MSAILVLASPTTSLFAKIKAIFQVIGSYRALNDLPEPTFENTWHPNSHRLIELRDEFFKHCVGLGTPRLKFMRAFINFIIIMYDYDRPYRDMMDWAKEALEKKGWDARGSQDLIAAHWPYWKEELDDA